MLTNPFYNPFLQDPISLNILIIAFLVFIIVEILCIIKISLVYKQNKNFVSILLILWFILGIILSLLTFYRLYEPLYYTNYFWMSLVLYIATMSTILFYILDIRELFYVPIFIAAVVLLQIFVSMEAFDINQSMFVQIGGMVPLIGFFYLAKKNKDGKSFGMAFHFTFNFMNGIFINANILFLAAIFQYSADLFLGLGIYGIFDKLLLYEKGKKAWIEEQFK